MRIYVPATLLELDAPAGLSPRTVHAVTRALRAAVPDEDEEGLEYVAQLLAADDSLDLLGGVPDAARRRVVVAADVPEALVEALDAGEDQAPSAVRLTTSIGWDDVACAHVDEPAARADVAKAVAGDAAAIERLEERDLLWYDVSEFPRLVAAARA